MSRIFKYANKGFGILIPACLLNTVEINFSQRRPHEGSLARREPSRPWDSDVDYINARSHFGYDQVTQEIVKGKKAVKRIAYMAEDMVWRLYIGATKLTTRRHRWNPFDFGEEFLPDNTSKCVDASFDQLNGREQSGMACLETFMRMVALWNLECDGKVKYVLLKPSLNVI